ncbi:MAG: Rrf2 family transcriptional regulator [Calditrichaeota bacterium]|nr:MAG: Rrf2 family transcriptional regulator [Calditrichota bacterium]MBL1206053.1 Rrf2 family transcriptional regulator [Calditrichota bacterium]NOG45880.1 Rrf2 family transcriptional regulator [Calditrichota bacterium]
MLLSKACIYGVRAAIYLAVYEERPFVPIKEIAETLNISFHFLTKILQILSKAGLIKSIKGPNGGVTLKLPAAKLTVFDIVFAIDGAEIFDECVLGHPGCSDDNPCSLHRIWRVTKEELRAELKRESLQDLAKQVQDGSIRLFDVY